MALRVYHVRRRALNSRPCIMFLFLHRAREKCRAAASRLAARLVAREMRVQVVPASKVAQVSALPKVGTR